MTAPGAPATRSAKRRPATQVHEGRGRDGKGRQRAARHVGQPVLRGHRRGRGLPPDYALLGKVTEGLDVVEKIGKLGDASETPTKKVTIDKVTIS